MLHVLLSQTIYKGASKPSWQTSVLNYSSSPKALFHRLANVLLGITSNSPVNVLGTRRLPNSVTVHLSLDVNATIVGELASCCNADLASSVDDAISNSKVITVLNKNSVVSIIRKVNVLDLSGSRHGNAEDSATATTRVDLVDKDVGGGILTVGELSVVVGEAKGSIPGASSSIDTLDVTDLDVSRLLDEKTAFADILGLDRGNSKTVNLEGLNSVAASTGNHNVTHSNTIIPVRIAIKTDTNSTTKIQRDITQPQVSRPRKPQPKVRITRHLEVRNLNIILVNSFNSTTTRFVADVHGTADFEGLSAGDTDGVGADAAGCSDRDALAAADAVERRLDGETVVRAGVDVCAVDGGGEGSGAGDYTLWGAIAAGCGGGGDEGETRG